MHSRDWHLSCASGLLALSLAAWAGPPVRVTPAPAAPPETASLISSALERMEEDPQLSLLLLLEAQARGPSLEGISALREWLGRPGRAVLRGHSGAVVAVAFSPNGQRLATASEDGTARLWDGVSGQPLAVLRGHAGPVRTLAFRPDGDWLATGGADGTVRLWEPGSGEELEVLRGHSSPVKTLLFRPGPARPQLVSVAEDGTAFLWHGREDGQPVPLGHEGRVHSVAFDAQGSRLITAGRDDYTREWNPESGEFLSEWFTHGIKFRTVAFSPDGERVVGTEGKAQVVLLSASAEKREEEGSLERLKQGLDAPVLSARFERDGQRILTVDEEGKAVFWYSSGSSYRRDEYRPNAMSPAGVRSVLFTPQSPYLLTLDKDGPVRLWASSDTSDAPLLELRGHEQEDVEVAAFSPDGSRIVTASRNGTARLWAVPDFNPKAVELELRGGSLQQALFHPDGTRLLTLEDSDDEVQLWDATTGRELQKLGTRGRPLLSVAFDAQGERIATLGQYDGYLRLWETDSGRPLRREALPWVPNLFTALLALGKDEPTHGKGTVTFSPDGQRILTHFTDHDALLWREQAGRALTLKGTASPLRPAFSPDGQRVATGGGPDEVVLWDVATGKELHRLRHDPASELLSLTFSPDGRRLATVGTRRPFVSVWEVASGRPLTVPHDVPMLTPTALAFSPDGTRVLTASTSMLGNWLWDSHSGEPLALLLPPRSGSTRSVAFSPDGTLLLLVGEDGDTGLWSATGGKPLWELKEPGTTQRSASFSPDGGRLLTVNKNNRVRVRVCTLCAPVEELVEQARPFLGRELTCDERRAYLHEEGTCPPSEERSAR